MSKIVRDLFKKTFKAIELPASERVQFRRAANLAEELASGYGFISYNFAAVIRTLTMLCSFRMKLTQEKPVDDFLESRVALIIRKYS